VSFALTILAFILALIVIIMVHELGHYLVARAFGFRVLEYFVGFGPRLWSRRKGEIDYGVKAIPAGGYVKIAGMNPFVDDVPPGDEDRAYYAKPIWQRALVIAAGPLSHVVIAFLTFAIVLLAVGDNSVAVEVDEVDAVLADGDPSPAAVAGLQPGDRFVSADGIALDRTFSELGAINREGLGRAIPYVIERGGAQLTVTMTPVVDCVDGRWGGVGGFGFATEAGPAIVAGVQRELLDGTATPAGVVDARRGDTIVAIAGTTDPTPRQVVEGFDAGLGAAIPITIERQDGTVEEAIVRPVRGCVEGQETARLGVILGPDRLPVGTSVVEGARAVGVSTATSVGEMWRVFGPSGIARIGTLLFTDEPRARNDPASLLGISKEIGRLGADDRWAQLFWSFGYITLFIGLLNLLPLPPFDGGHLAVLVIEKIRKRRVDPRAMVPVSAAVLSFFVLFSLAALVLDVAKPIPTSLP
jgi:RIP metalloprotease RseP